MFASGSQDFSFEVQGTIIVFFTPRRINQNITILYCQSFKCNIWSVLMSDAFDKKNNGYIFKLTL